MSAGTVSELYLDPSQGNGPKDSWGENRGDVATPAPPTAPSSIPAPAPTKVEVTVNTKRRMADETPDGKIRDTSAEAMREGNDLGIRRFDEEQKQAPTETTAPPAETKPAVAETKPAVPETPKVYAGKFKTVEELEKSYEEAQKLITKQGQEVGELRKQAAQPKAPEPPPQPKISDEERKNQLLQEFVNDPEKFLSERDQKAAAQAMAAVETERMRSEWRTQNADIADAEKFVAVEMASLIQTDPELAKNPSALLKQATDNFRQFTGKIRSDAAKEALTTETRVIPLVTNTAPPAATEQPAKAPLTSDEAYALHMKMLKDNERKSHRGLRP